MNRLRAVAATKPIFAPLLSPSSIEQGTASILGGESSSVLFAPIHYERNYAYPLVVWLHGDGQDERQLVRLMSLVSLRNYVGVAPRGTRRSARAPVAGGDVTAERSACFEWSEQADELAAAEHRVFEAIESAERRYHIAAQRVFLAGADGGGTVAQRIALAHPTRFAGSLSFGGAFPAGRAPLARLSEVRRLPLFIAYAFGDGAFAPERLDDQMRLFYAAGMRVTLRQYPWRGRLTPEMLADADRWMMEIVTGGDGTAG